MAKRAPPNHVIVTGPRQLTGGSLKAPVYSLELLGDATMATVRVGGVMVSIKATKEFRADIGETVNARISTAICHLFDSRTGAHL